MNKFTPGLWTVETWGDGSSPDGYANVFADKAEVCIADGVPIADARLIAEAPEMYELLEFYASDSNLQTFNDRETFRKKARAIIEKVRGKS